MKMSVSSLLELLFFILIGGAILGLIDGALGIKFPNFWAQIIHRVLAIAWGACIAFLILKYQHTKP